MANVPVYGSGASLGTPQLDLARIKGNVAKMAAQNAPETDIDGYIASEGATVDQVRAFSMPTAGASASPSQPTGYDAGLPAQGLSGVNEGIANVLGFPVDAANTVMRGGAAALHAVGGPDIELPVDTIGGSQSIKAGMGGAIKPPTDDWGGQMVRRVGQEVGASIVPGAGIVARSARPIATAARQIGTAVASGTGAAVADQIAPDNPYVDMVGQILGGGAFAAGAKGLQKAVTPFPIDPNRAAHNAVMAKEGVDLTAGQQTGNKGLQIAEQELAGGQTAAMTEKQREQFTSAALSKAGVSANRANPQVMDQAFTDIGARFDDIAARNTLIPDQQLGKDLHDSLIEYNDHVSPSNRAPVVENTLKDVVAAAKTGQISGELYQSVRSRLERAARTTKDPELMGALRDIKGSLDDAMERSITASNPNDLGEWQQVRGDYKNLLVIENAVAKAGPDAASGLITPANLRSAAMSQGKRAYVRGQGDFNDLAHAGEVTMPTLANSNTAGRAAVRGIFNLPAVAGSILGSQHGMEGAVAGAVAGGLGPRVVGGLMMSGPGKSYLTNQIWAGGLDLGTTAIGPAVATMTDLTSGKYTTPPPSGQVSDPSLQPGAGGSNSIPRIYVHGATRINALQ